jgi:hypothetical protein
MVEMMPLRNYYPAEEYHQKYLDKNPGGYCHIGEEKFEKCRKESEITVAAALCLNYLFVNGWFPNILEMCQEGRSFIILVVC